LKINTSNWPDIFLQTGDRINNWLASVNLDVLILSAVGVALVFFLRKKLAEWLISGTQTLMKRFSVSLSDEVMSQLIKAGEVLVVTLALLFSMEALHFPEAAGEILRRVISSVAIIAVFSTWYSLSGPFVSYIRSEKYGNVKVESDWIEHIAQIAIILFGITALLRIWNVDISGALTGVGVLGAGLALASQDMIANLGAGMTNMSEKRFETGDTIEVEGQFVGTVKRIDLRSTLVVGFDQIPRHVPNSDLSNSVVLNYSARKHRRVKLKVPLLLSSTHEQIEAVRDGLKDYVQTCGDFDLSADAPKYVHISDLGPSSVDILIYVWTTGPDYDQLLQVTERLTLTILKIVKNAGTALAYPTRTIQVDRGAASDDIEPDRRPL